ncbi:hypothetical protein MNBD_CHLOROFLEXI01-526 [hydrothermal vent metagenome]|uniref:Uncharacterized protein n=1 Tax=hydrothermal vent metagenome TaxID=652676 RepID=A0A3B0UJA9_9ZZZZ
MTSIQKFFCYLVYTLCLIMLHSCTMSKEDETRFDSQQPTPVELATVTKQILSSVPPSSTATTPLSITNTSPSTATATPTHPPQVHTPTLPSINNEFQEQEQEIESIVDACDDTIFIFNLGNSDKGKVYWRLDDAGGLYCCEHAGTVYQINQNSNPASNLVLISIITDGNVPINSANILVNLATGMFKILEPNYIGEPKYKLAWLPDERVVWVNNEGELYIGSIETQESLNAPAKMTDLWFVSPDRILTRDEALQFWYFDLQNSTWTQLSQNESEKITWGWIDYAEASEDGEYVFFFFHDSIAILSNHLETVNIIEREELYPIVSSGSDEYPLWSSPKQIKGTPYWLLNTIWLIRDFSGISYPTFGFIIDSRTGDVVEHEILGIPSELAIYDSYLSPDRMWVAVEVVEAIQTLETYPAKVSQTWFISLSTGEVRMEDGEFAGWDAESQAYLNLPLTCTQQEIFVDLTPPIKD